MTIDPTASWYLPTTPQHMRAEPWLHGDAIDYLAGILLMSYRVAEQGSGGSTLWMAERCRSVVAFEHDPDWYQAVRAKAPRNCTLIPWTAIERMPELPYKVDLVLIDGDREGRRVWLANIRRYLAPSGWIVLDNANRPEYALERASLGDWCTLEARFDRNHWNSHYFVTEFWRAK